MSSLFIKVFATIFMLIDHIGIVFDINLFRMLGRVAFPLFAFQMAIGLKNTQNPEKRIIKLLIFATLCQIPYMIFHFLNNYDYNTNIIFTFVFSSLIIYVCENIKIKCDGKISIKDLILKIILIPSLLFFAHFVKVDYDIYGVLLTVLFYYAFDKKLILSALFFMLLVYNMVITHTYASVINIISLVDLIIILNYNHEKNYKSGKVFYHIYFWQFVVLSLLKFFLINK